MRIRDLDPLHVFTLLMLTTACGSKGGGSPPEATAVHAAKALPVQLDAPKSAKVTTDDPDDFQLNWADGQVSVRKLSNPLASGTLARAVEHFTTLEDRNIHQEQTADGWTATSEETISGETVTNLIQHRKIGGEELECSGHGTGANRFQEVVLACKSLRPR